MTGRQYIIAFLVLVITCSLIALAAHAAPKKTYTPRIYTGTVVRVIDGDSFIFDFPECPAFQRPCEVRVVGIDTPEHSLSAAQAPCEVPLGIAAGEYAKTLLKPGDAVQVTWDGHAREKWRRLLGTVKRTDGGDYGQAMIAAGYARPYDGGHKDPWCGGA